VLAFYLKRCTDRPHAPLHKFFSAEGGTAAFEFLLGMPSILMILLLVLECALLWNANMIIHYAGFAATRAAITTIQSSLPASPTDPPDGSGPYEGEANYMVNNPEPQDGSPPLASSLKLVRIHRAAAIALTPISDEYPTSECDDWDIFGLRNLPETITNGITTAIQNAGTSDPNQPWPQHIAKRYAYAWANSTITLEIPHHWRDGDPNVGCPYNRSLQGAWGPTPWGGNYAMIPHCPYCYQIMDYAWNEPLTVTLTYYIPLEIPYANAALNKLGLGEPYVIPGSGENSYKLLVTVVTEL